VSRRALLAGTAGIAGAAVVTACSSGKGGKSSATTALMKLSSDDAKAKSQLVLLQLFPNDSAYAYPGAPQRLNFALGNSEGAFLDTGPPSLSFVVTDSSGKQVGAPIDVALHDKDLQKGYYPLIFTPPAPGTYTATARTSGQTLTAAIQVWDKGQVQIPGPGDRMPSLVTPTVANPAGVDPICTLAPQCPLHSISLDTALTQHRPIAFLIATPAHCKTATCGPVVSILLGAQAEFGDKVTLIHNEVYKSGQLATKNINAPGNLTPAIEAMRVTFEPLLVLVKPDGTILRRLDTLFDSTELRQGLQDLLAA
jgi:hypothetical protein